MARLPLSLSVPIALLTLFMCRQLSLVLVPVMAAGVTVLLLSGPMERLQRRGWSAAPAAAVLVLLPMVAVVSSVALGRRFDMLPVERWSADASAASTRIVGLIEPLAAGNGAMASIARWAMNQPVIAGDGMAGWAAEQFLLTIAALSVVTMLVFFGLVAQRPAVAALLDALPGDRSRARCLGALREARAGVAVYLATMGWVNLALAVATGVAVALLGLQHAVLWSVVAFVLLFVPYLGPLAITLMLLAAGHDTFDTSAAMFGPPLAFLVLHALEAHLLSPWIVGQQVRISRIALLLGVLAGGWAWGVIGGVLAVPLLIVARAALRRLPGHGLAKALLYAEPVAPPALDAFSWRPRAPVPGVREGSGRRGSERPEDPGVAAQLVVELDARRRATQRRPADARPTDLE